MFPRRPGALGLLVLLTVLAGCTSEAASIPTETTGAPALHGYRAPSRAPEFCALLAGSSHLRTLPQALGALVVEPSDADARQELAAAVTDLRSVLDAVHFDVEYADLETAVEELVDALTEASGGRVRTDLGETVSRTLATIADEAQPACEFPT